MALDNPPIASDVHENWLFQFTADNNNCMVFNDGDNNYLNFGDIFNSFDTDTAGYTIEFWYQLESTGANPILSFGYNDSASEDETTNVQFNVSVASGDTIKLSWEHDNGTGKSEQYDIDSGTNTWTHIAISRNNSDNKTRFYKNGAIVHTTNAETADPSGGTSSDMEFLVGRNQNYSSGNYFEGKMAHLRVWSTIRSDQEISKHYNTVIDNTATGLLGYWKLDEGSGDTVYDSSSSSNNGAVKNNNKVAGPGSATVWDNGGFDKHIHAFGLALRDTVADNNFYHGSILNKNISLRESIDITSGKSSTSNITLTSANFETQGTEFYKTLLNNAERNYINRKVIVYAQFFNEDTLSNCQKIFTGRLVDIQLNQDGNVTMQINSHRPWDGISFPQTQTTNGIYQPSVYGDYTIHGDKSLVREHANAVFPVPFKHKAATTDFLIVTPLASSDIRPCYYDATADAFLGIKADNYTAATKNLDSDFDANTNIGIVKREMRRRFRINPVTFSSDGSTTFNNAQNLLLNHYNISGVTHDYSDSVSSEAKNFYANFAVEIAKVNVLDLDIKGTVTTPNGQDETDLLLRVNFSGNAGNYFNGQVQANNSATSFTASNLVNNTSESSTSYAKISLLPSLSANNLAAVNLSSTISSHTSNSVSLVLIITDLVLYCDIQHSYDETKGSTNNSLSSLSSLKYLYLPIDGLTASWDSGAISHGHDAHRDLLQRFAGIPSTDPEVNSGEAWSVLNDDRAIDNWKIRYWQLEPVLLKDMLDKLAYEFGFVAKFTANEKMKYIYVKKSSELTATLNLTKMDINRVHISTTGIQSIVTQMDISNKLHPADSSRYYVTTNSLNTTSRVKYNLGDKEGIQKINLDTNVGTIPTTADADCNADFYSYYNNIVGDIKILVQCDVVNPMKGCQLETGDVITFSDMPVEMFGTDFDNTTYFMIVDLNRSPGKVSITAREVG
jgi:hypothetical protein